MLRIGIDIVSIGRLEAALGRWPRLAGRLFTERELRYANSKARPGEHLAARFAAKEATFKALGSGWPKLGWHEVEVISTSSGPRLALTGRAQRLAAEAAPVASLSHDGGMAVAQVILVSAL